MARGPKPSPTPLKILRGSRKSRLNAQEPLPPSLDPEMPSHLDDVAQAEWRRFAPILRSMGILTQADGPVLAIYCSAYSRWVKAEEEIAKAIAADASNPLAGLTVSQATGSSKVGPMVTISKHAQATMLKILTEFGCTPSSRSKVKVTQVKRDDLDDFIEAPKKKAR